MEPVAHARHENISPSGNRQIRTFSPKSPHIPSISSLVNIPPMVDAAGGILGQEALDHLLQVTDARERTSVLEGTKRPSYTSTPYSKFRLPFLPGP